MVESTSVPYSGCITHLGVRMNAVYGGSKNFLHAGNVAQLGCLLQVHDAVAHELLSEILQITCNHNELLACVHARDHLAYVKQMDQVATADLHGNVQRRQALRILHIPLRAMLDEERAYFYMLVPACVKQWSGVSL
jgi:hypothetical protein